MIYDFAVDDDAVTEYQGIMRQQPSIRNPQERRRALGNSVGTQLAANLAGRLRRMGFAVVHTRRGAGSRNNDLAIDGRVLTIDEGSPLRRLVVGFGSGAARLETRVKIVTATERKILLEFSTRTDSGRFPGAAVTLPVGAALPPGLSLGITAGSVVAKGVNENSSQVDQMAVSNAEQTVQYLIEFFVRQRWIDSPAAGKSKAHS